MLCGATISGIVVAVSYILKEFQSAIYLLSSFQTWFLINCLTGRIEIKSRFTSPSALHELKHVGLSPYRLSNSL